MQNVILFGLRESKLPLFICCNNFDKFRLNSELTSVRFLFFSCFNQVWTVMFDDDDDDGVDPQIEDVNRYYFEDGEEKPVCFSILPFQFGEDDSEADFLRKDVFLCGFVDKNLPVYKEVVAWKIRLDSEHPNIYVLSIEHKWIKLLKPRKCYGDIVRSTLITVQMLHFFGRGEQRSSNHLWDHLDEVFGYPSTCLLCLYPRVYAYNVYSFVF